MNRAENCLWPLKHNRHVKRARNVRFRLFFLEHFFSLYRQFNLIKWSLKARNFVIILCVQSLCLWITKSSFPFYTQIYALIRIHFIDVHPSNLSHTKVFHLRVCTYMCTTIQCCVLQAADDISRSIFSYLDSSRPHATFTTYERIAHQMPNQFKWNKPGRTEQ